VPHLARRDPIDWRRHADLVVERMLAVVDRRFPGFTAQIELSRAVTPVEWADQGLAGGTPFSAAHTFTQTGPFRPQTRAPGIDNLLFCGANTQPGVGVPMVLVSGALAAQRVTGLRTEFGLGRYGP